MPKNRTDDMNGRDGTDVAELTQAAREGALHVPAVEPLPLADIARAHELVDAGSRRRVLLDPRR